MNMPGPDSGLAGIMRRVSLPVLILLAVLVAAALGLLVLLPMHRLERQLEGEYLARQSLVQEVNRLAETYTRLQAQVASNAPEADLTARITASLQEAGLQASSMQVNTDGSLQLRIESVEFNQALAWLALLEQQPGVLLATVDVVTGSVGQVNLSVIVKSAL